MLLSMFTVCPTLLHVCILPVTMQVRAATGKPLLSVIAPDHVGIGDDPAAGHKKDGPTVLAEASARL